MRRTLLILATVLSTSLAPPVLAAPSADSLLKDAQAYEATLTRDSKRLRLRHNLERLVRMWEATEKRSHGAQRRLALEGEARAWKLLARWSGLDEDRARARAIAGRLEQEPPEREAPRTARAEKPERLERAEREDKLARTGRATATERARREPADDRETARHLKRSTREAVRSRSEDLISIRRVVIDAGHGGKDQGARGAGGVLEKDVNLAVAKKLGDELRRRLGVKVIFTRTTDRFLTLERRSRIANSTEADLFISVHANAHAKRSVHGVETYYLDTTSDRYAARLAERENTGRVQDDGLGDAPEPGVGMPDHDEPALPGGALGRDLRLLLADLAMRSASAESRRLAGHVQSAVIGNLRRKQGEVSDLGVKHALFYVLLGARMPAILIETGFVTHPTEGRRLRDRDYQAQLASAIAQGITRWVSDRDAALRASLADARGQKIASAGDRIGEP